MKMDSPRTFTGKTVDEATENALEALGVDLEDVEIRVLSPGRSGILGFGGEPARIEITVIGQSAGASHDDDDDYEESDFDDESESSESEDDSDETEPASSRTEQPSSEERAPRGRSRGRSRGPRTGERSTARGGRGGARGGRSAAGRDEAPAEDAPEPVEAVAPGGYDDEEEPERRPSARGGRGRSSRTGGRSQDRAEGRQRPQQETPPAERDEEAEQLVGEVLDYFLATMGVVAETYVRDDTEDGSLVFEIEGEDAGLLIGRRGETLQALQFLVRMVVSRQLGRKAFVLIDVEDYRQRRADMLQRLARRTAGRVASSGRSSALDPMPPGERRIVHMALASHPRVTTESEGEGNQRRVVILPRD
jgi:spoIIIJ-associated protein